jgi:hypothetical protein
MLKIFINFAFFILLFNIVIGAPTTTDGPSTTAAPEGGTKEEAEMKVVVKKISDLAKQIIQLMGTKFSMIL